MNFIRESFYRFVDDKLQLLSLIGFFAISVFSILNYIEEPNVEWLLRIIIFGAGVILTIVFSHKGTWIAWFLVAIVIFHFSTYRNISYFTIIMILISFYEKSRYPLLVIYTINVFIICHIHNLQIMKICFHLCCCAFIYFSVNEIARRLKNIIRKDLILEDDEKLILDYLSKGIQQNDIPDFVPQTVSRKLRAAKIRNGIENTKKLVDIYKQQFIKD